MSVQNSKIPKFSMRILNLRNLYDEIFQRALVGDAYSVQYLLESGQASVKDISSDSGHSALHVSIAKIRDIAIGFLELILVRSALQEAVMLK